MRQKIGPFLLIGFLALILVFILGVRLGRNVEKTNKIINYLISIPPTATPVPTVPSLAFETFNHKNCGVRFLYPNNLKEVGTSSFSAQLSQVRNDDEGLRLECPTTPPAELDFGTAIKLSTAAGVMTFQGRNIAVWRPLDAPNDLYFEILNPRNRKTLRVYLDSSILPLFEKSLEFSP